MKLFIEQENAKHTNTKKVKKCNELLVKYENAKHTQMVKHKAQKYIEKNKVEKYIEISDLL